MKKIFLLFALLHFTVAFSQDKWFEFYKDSVSIARDADNIAAQFVNDIRSIYPNLNFNLEVRLKTTPLLIYYGTDKVAYYPLWNQLNENLQNWFYQLGGNEAEGKRIFALFFNGFYLPHELAHGFEDSMNHLNPSYENEYFANTAAMLWWRKHGYENQLNECYQFAKKILLQTPNPVPEGENVQEFFTKNYFTILESGNPYTYGYMQFNQFITIYEDESLGSFEEFIKDYYSKKQRR